MKTTSSLNEGHFSRSYKMSMLAILILFLFTMVIGPACSVRKVPSTLPTASSSSTENTPSPIHADSIRSAVISPPPLPDCPGLPPICKGIPALLSQDVDPTTINNFITKYSIQFPWSCRFQQPPRCAKKEVVNCTGRCTP